MIDRLIEATETAGFWVLGLGGTAAVVLGWKVSKGVGTAFPLWQLFIIIAVAWLAAAFFTTKE